MHTAVGDDRHVGVLYKRVEELEKKLQDLETKKIIDETQIPSEVLASNGMLPESPNVLRRGRGWRPLLRSDIEEAIKVSPFCTDQAKHLRVHISTYRKYALKHGLWFPQPHHKGCKKPWGPEKGKYPLSKILAGEFNNNPLILERLTRAKIVKAKIFPEECQHCGYKERSIISKHVPLLIDHKDGNDLNWKLENIRFLCFNCVVQVGRGRLSGRIRKFDPNFIKEGDWA